VKPLIAVTAAALVALALVGCSSDSTSPRESDVPQVGGPDLSVNRAIKGRKVSVFLKYGSAAPADRVARVMAMGAAFANDVRSERVIAVDVLPDQVEALRHAPWVIESEVDTTTSFLAADVLPRGVDLADAELVHSRGNRGTGVRVAFLDGGVKCTNGDLIGRIKGGYDFILGNSNYCTNNGTDYRDQPYIDHGSAVAQIIGAGLNGSYYLGMAPESDLYSLRVCNAEDKCSSSRIYSALIWARDHGMQVVSASIGDCGDGISTSVFNAMNAVNAAGIPQTWAGGNGNGGSTSGDSCSASDPPSSYTQISYTIGVSAFSSFTGVAKSGFQYGPQIDISAPTDVQYVTFGGNSNGSFGGTSAATPHVAGALALLIRQRFSGVSLLTERLTSTATDAGSAGKDNQYGYGKLNANAAVAPIPAVTAIAGPATPIKTASTYTLTATVSNGLPPYAVKWNITYSNGVRPNVSTAYGSASYSLQVPAGSYSISVTATPKETKWLRVGSPLIRTFPVCTGTSAPLVLAAKGPSGGTRIIPNAIGGCTSPPPQ
jgi:hypothetical protein